MDRWRRLTPWIAGGGVALLLVLMAVGDAAPTWMFTAGVVVVAVGAVAGRVNEARAFRVTVMGAACCVFILSQLVSTAFSVDRSLSAQGLAPLSIGVLLLFASAHAVSHPRALWMIVGGLASVAAVVSLDVLVQWRVGRSVLSGQGPMGGRYPGSLPHPNDFALAAACLPFLLCLFVGRRGAWRLAGLTLGGVPVLAAAALTQSRTALGGVVLAWLVVAIVGLRGVSRWVVLGAIAAVGGAAWAVDAGGVRGRVLETLSLQSEGRLGLWLVAWEMFREAPIVGKGPHTYGLFYPGYLARVRLPDGYTPLIAEIPWAHNVCLEFLGERGVLGLAAMCALAGAVLVTAWRGARRDAGADGISLGVLASTVALLAMSVFDLSAQKDWCVFVMSVLIGLLVGQATGREVGAPTQPSSSAAIRSR